MASSTSTAAMRNSEDPDDSTIEVSIPRSKFHEQEADHVGRAHSSNDHAHPSPPADLALGLDGASKPRRGSFTADIPPGHMIPRPIDSQPPGLTGSAPLGLNAPGQSAPAAAGSGINPGKAANRDYLSPHADGHRTDSDPDFKNSKPLIFNTSAPVITTSTPSQAQKQGMFGMLQLDPPRPSQMGPPREPKTSSRRVKNYTLSDGTVVSGKGLGRGRPGIKRGPRNLKHQTDDPHGSLSSPYPEGSPNSEESPMTPAMTATAPGKRKWSAGHPNNTRTRLSESASATSGSRDSSPEYHPLEETRSGRKTQKPTPITVPPTQSTSPATKRPRLDAQPSGASASPSAHKSHPRIKRRIYRGREQLALCEHCLRGHGPSGNVIVFCDACNKCWHQRCHDPQVPQSVIADTKAEWFCSDCDRILHGKKGKKAKPAKSTDVAAPSAPSQPSFTGPLIGGSALTQAQRTGYLHSLSKDRLISLILSASELAPALPLFQAPAPQLPQAQFTSNYTTPISATPNHHTAAIAAEEDEGYDSYFDEHALLYPKPGQGIKLPAESTDLHMLLEGKDSRTFSHWVRGRPGQEFSGTGDVRVY